MHRHLVAPRAVLIVALLSWAAPRPAIAQAFLPHAELAGSWAPLSTEDVSNDSLPVDYMALPLTEEARLRALSYSESQLGMIERQCEGWPAWYMVQGPFGLKISNETEPAQGRVVSYTIGAWEDKAPMVIWMDGRPHPSKYAEHTRGGFTTGRWEGNTLVARTTHMKAGFLRKNGPPSSDLATMTSRFFRHGDVLTVLVVVEDPLYLAEPYVISKSFQVSPAELSAVGPPCLSTFEGTALDAPVPHYVPEKNPFAGEMSKKYGLPPEVVLGYPETLYPEYRQKLRR